MMLVHRSRGWQACAVGAGQERTSASVDQVFVQVAATGNDFVAAITGVVESGVEVLKATSAPSIDNGAVLR